MQNATTYVISQNSTCWSVHRLGEQVSRVASGVGSEEDALAIAMSKAKEDTPSQILRVSLTAEHRVIATYDDTCDATDDALLQPAW